MVATERKVIPIQTYSNRNERCASCGRPLAEHWKLINGNWTWNCKNAI
jgi:DNA-directed RNA polymerase subunit N (RpoN/RPB10)